MRGMRIELPYLNMIVFQGQHWLLVEGWEFNGPY